MRKRSVNRTGAVTLLFVFLLLAVCAVGAMALDYAVIESTKTDLRIGADLAARAASVEFIDSESLEEAIDRAQEIVAVNNIPRVGFQLDDSDIVPGRSVRQADDKYLFVANQQPYNSFRVNARLETGSVNGPMPLVFSGFHDRESVELSQASTVAEINLDIVLVLDRSGSMAFDTSGIDWSYPGGGSWVIKYYEAPEPDSRWEGLEGAIQVFINEMNKKTKKENVALVTYSSTVTYWSNHFQEYFSAVEVTTDQGFTTNYNEIMSAVTGIGDQPVIGGTAISSGMDRARTLLNNSPRAGQAEKIMILLTDGQWNHGYNPETAATYAKNDNIVIHTVSFGSGASSTVMDAIAKETGGDHYNAPTTTALEDAFEEIAKSIGLRFTQ